MHSTPFGKTETQEVTAVVELQTVYNILMGLSLLTTDDTNAEVTPWIQETATRLTPEQRYNNRLVFEGLGEILLTDHDYTDFVAYIDGLAVKSPTVLRDRLVERLVNLNLFANHAESIGSSLTTNDLLADAQLYIHQLKRCYPHTKVDESLQAEVHALLNKPDAMQELITTHLRTLWKTEAAAEWKRSLRNVQSMVHLLNEHSWTKENAVETIRNFIRREVPDAITMQLSDIQRIVFVPSPFVKLHATQLGRDTTLWVFVLAHWWSLPLRSEPIKRSEVLGPLRALADETRLHLLELLAANGKLRAQELIEQMDVSQPTVSRHLKQLLHAEFITEERGTGANKIYQLNCKRTGWLHYSLQELLSAENAQMVLNDPRLDYPKALRRFLDRQVRVTTWPAKQNDRQMVLDYLITKFEPEEEYTEGQVNQLINQWHTYEDPAYLRRALVDSGLLSRTPNGAKYWRTT